MDKENLKETFEDLEELQHNDLDDIVLENFDKKEKIKKYLLMGGAVLLIFIIVISIVKMVSDSSSAPQDELVETQPIEQTTQEATQDTNFQEVPIATESGTEQKSDVDQVINEVMQQQKSAPSTATVSAAATASGSQPIAKMSETTQKAKEPKTPAKKPAKPKTASKPAPKTAAAKPKPKPAAKPAPKPVAKGNIYIQVGAFLKYDPDKAFLRKIKAAGFNYIIKEYTINGKRVKRVYVGPFASRADAKEALAKVRARIAKGAFITKVR